jgi:hypothetical protein
MKKLTNCFMFCVVLLVLAYTAADAQFSGNVAFVTTNVTNPGPSGSTTNPTDPRVVDSLTAWGFTVHYYLGGNNSTAGSFNNTTAPLPTDADLVANYRLVLYSEYMSSGNGYRVRGLPIGGPWNTMAVPVISLDNWFVKSNSIGFISTQAATGTTFGNIADNDGGTTGNASTFAGSKNVDILDDQGTSFSSGFDYAGTYQIMASVPETDANGAYLNFACITPAEGQTILPIAGVSGNTTRLIAWGAEIGTTLYSNTNPGVLQPDVTLKKRYAAVGVMAQSYVSLTNEGWQLFKNAITWVLEPEVGVKEDKTMPTGFSLKQNYPNPFNPTTKLQFSLEKNGFAALKVYNLLGQEIATLFEGNAKAGYLYEREFNASGLTSGVYFVRLASDSKSQVIKLMLMK